MRRAEHREQQPADATGLIPLRPRRVQLGDCGERGRGAEAHEGHDGQEEADIRVKEDLPAGSRTG